jgi:DNA-binding CsgD family transcriptional regulator
MFELQSNAKAFVDPLSAWQVLDSLCEAMAVVDRSYRIIWFKEPLQSCPGNHVKKVGRYCYDVLYERSRPCTPDCPVTPVLQTGKPYMVERHLLTPDGEEIWREARAYPICDRRGKVTYVARISFDITHRKQQQQKQDRDRDNLERALDQMNHFQLDQMPFQPVGGALSSRELEVLRLLAQGLSKPRISDVLGISINTTKRHVSNIFNKLGVNDRAQAAVWATRQGLV